MTGAGNPLRHPLAVYVHWPFCAQKCPYCDFNSHVRHGGIDEPRFLAAYLAEIDHTAERLRHTPPHGEAPVPHQGSRVVTSVFFGGGTPSLMSPATVAAILDRISAHWSITPDAEITLEANPSSVEAARFRLYRATGVNRVSLGVQSLLDHELRRLGRLHDAAEARAAIAVAARTFDRTSFDLIYARPGQTTDQWRAELGDALALAGGHLSLYQLTIEPETPFAALHAAGKLVIPDPDAALALYEVTQELTAAAGLDAYEISNHARPGEESRHNLAYWRYGEYAGIGAGAHGRLVIGGRRHATVTEKSPEAWLERVEAAGHGLTDLTPLTPAEEADEMLLMGLRLVEGLDLDRLEAVTGARPSDAEIADLVGLGLVERVGAAGPAGGVMQAVADRSSEIAACVSPGAGGRDEWGDVTGPAPATGATAPVPSPVVRATGQGRFVLNEIVRRLSRTLDSRRS